jgi:hypothetical protein
MGLGCELPLWVELVAAGNLMSDSEIGGTSKLQVFLCASTWVVLLQCTAWVVLLLLCVAAALSTSGGQQLRSALSCLVDVWCSCGRVSWAVQLLDRVFL